MPAYFKSKGALMLKKIFFLTAALFASLLSAKPLIIASIAPVAYLAKAVVGDSAEVKSLAKGDVHSFDPKPNDMKAIVKADLFIATGLEFEEAWIPRFKASAPKLVVVESDAKIAKLKGEHEHEKEDDKHEKEGKDHDHEKEGDEHGEHEAHADPHVWLNPMLARTQAKNICDALIDLYPQNKDLYLQNFTKLSDELLAFDESAKESLVGLKNRKFVVYHPAWEYFAAHYDLEQISIEKDGKEPKINEMASTVKMIKDENIKVIFADPNRSQKSAQVLATQTGAKVELLDPLGYNLLENLKIAVEAIKNANLAK